MSAAQAFGLVLSMAKKQNRKDTPESMADTSLAPTSGVRKKCRHYMRCFHDKRKIKLGGDGKKVVVDHCHNMVHRSKFKKGKNGHIFLFDIFYWGNM